MWAENNENLRFQVHSFWIVKWLDRQRVLYLKVYRA